MPTIYPTSDIAINGWTTNADGTTNLYATIDEVSADDADFIQSPVGPVIAQFYEADLPTPGETPTVDTGHVVRYRYRKPGASDPINLTARLVGFGNLVPSDAGGIEVDISDWEVVSECTLARVTTPVRSGSGALRMTKSATVTTYMAARLKPFSLLPVSPGVEYTTTIYFRAATTARDCQVWMDWTDSGGGHISGPSASATNTTSGWTAVTVVGTAPGNAAFIRPVPQINGVALNEIHYVDDVSVVGPGGTIASWAHTDIGTSWTAAAQTLSEAQAAGISDYSTLSLRFTPSVVGASEYNERHSPDALISTSGVTIGALVTMIQDDPNSPDLLWITASSNNTSGWVHVSFPSPTGPLKGGGNFQGFQVWVRKQGGTGSPWININVYDNGTLVGSGPTQFVDSTSGQLHAIVWNPSLIASGNMANVECRVVFTASGGGGPVRASVDVGAVEWNAVIQPAATGRAQVSWANLELPGGGPPPPASMPPPSARRRPSMRSLLTR